MQEQFSKCFEIELRLNKMECIYAAARINTFLINNSSAV